MLARYLTVSRLRLEWGHIYIYGAYIYIYGTRLESGVVPVGGRVRAVLARPLVEGPVA